MGDDSVFDDLKRLFDQTDHYRKLAKAGPITDELIRDGAAFYLSARRQCDLLLTSPRVSRDAGALRPGVELPEYQNAAALIALGRRLTVRDAAIKNVLSEVIPIYAEKGVAAMANVLARRFKPELRSDFSEELRWAHALKEHLDRQMLVFLLEGMKRNKLRMDERHFDILMTRVGIDAMERAMEHAKRINA